MAFSNDARVMISRGLRSSSSKFFIVAPMLSASACFSGYSAGKEDEPGRVMPRASAADAMVLAVYIWREYVLVKSEQRKERQILHHHRRLLRDKHFE